MTPQILFTAFLLLIITTCDSCASAPSTALMTNTNMQKFGITPQEFGAVGDGRADDTRAFEQALTTAQESGRTIFIPVGKYKITKTLLLKKRVTLVGENEQNSIIIFAPKGTGLGPLLKFNGGKNTDNSRIEHIRFQMQGFGVDKPNVHVIVFEDSSPGRLILNDVCFFGFTGYGLYLTGKTTYGQNLALTNLSFYRMGGLIGQSDDRGISDWWTNLVVISNINLDAYSGHSVNLVSPQEYLVDLRGWRMVNITNLLVEGAIQKPTKIKSSLRLGGGYSSKGSNYLGLGNATLTGFWEEFSSNSKPQYSIVIDNGMSSIVMRDIKAKSFQVNADALNLHISGKRFSVLAQADQRIEINGDANVMLEDILASDGDQIQRQRSNAASSKLKMRFNIAIRIPRT